MLNGPIAGYLARMVCLVAATARLEQANFELRPRLWRRLVPCSPSLETKSWHDSIRSPAVGLKTARLARLILSITVGNLSFSRVPFAHHLHLMQRTHDVGSLREGADCFGVGVE